MLIAYIFLTPVWVLAASILRPATYTNVFETVYIDEGKTLSRVDRRHEGEFVISDGTEIIGPSALWGCYTLTSVIIPDSVTNIMERAFETCSLLTNVVFGSGVRTIGKRAFSGTPKLTNIDLPDSVETIDEGVFMTVPPKNIRVGNALRKVGPYAFGSNTTLGTNTLDRFVTISPSNQWIRIEDIQIAPIKQEERGRK